MSPPATTPCAPPPAAAADAAALWPRALLDGQLAILGRLAEVGLDVAEAVGRKARGLARDEGDDEIDTEADADEAPGGVATVALAFARVSRAVRITVALQAKLIADFEAFGQTLARARREADTLVGQDRPARVQKVARIVERVIEADQGLTDERFKEVCDEASHWLDDETLSGNLDRPFSVIVADICRDLGLSPDWAALAQEGWARDEAAGRCPCSPEAPAAPAARPWPRVKDEKAALAAANTLLNAAFAWPRADLRLDPGGKPPRAPPPHPSG